MKAALIVLDGWGLGSEAQRASGISSGGTPRESEDGGRNAIVAAETPNFDRLSQSGAYGTLDVTGRRVGLPEGQMGNSEVGHLNIGAGRVVTQEYTRIEDAIANGELGDNEAIASAFDYAAGRGPASNRTQSDDANSNDGTVHFMGLVSEGGVHSDQRHLYALVELAAERGVEAVTHAFTDGRDTPPKSGAGFLADLQSVVDEQGTGDVATVSGRYYAMDRDQNWERTKRAYDAIVERDAAWEADSAVDAVENSYDRDDTDEFVEPTLIDGGPALQDGDAVVFFNFRSDRARQLTRMLADIDPVWAFDTSPPDIELVTMTEYDQEFDLPVAFPPHQPEDTLGEVVSAAGLTQLRIAESEKYAHVTYFLNGGREVEFDGERREIIESPDVPTYDQKPEMSAAEVTDTAISVVESDDPDLLVLNYANPDMVGHTGDFDAAVEAVEAVDAQLGRLVEVLSAHGAHVFVTADHGNADDMGTPEDPHTAHTYNAVPLLYLSPDGDDAGKHVRGGGSLCDLAPTVLAVMGVDRPAAMTGENLLE